MTALDDTPATLTAPPDATGRFGEFGGRFVPETLVPACQELEVAFGEAWLDPTFRAELTRVHTQYSGRPSIMTECHNLGAQLGIRLILKREDLNHTGSHKINNVIGQTLLAKRMGKKRIVADTGAGQHGVASATAAALMGLECKVYMGAVDVERQKPNVFRMNLLGAEVRPVTSGSATLKDAMNEALRDWVTNVHDTYYLIGTAAGMHPYPEMVRDFQSVIGKETRAQMLEAEGRLPDAVVACVGGGSNAIGIFHPFLNDEGVKLIGVEAAGEGMETGRHAAAINGGRPGVLHGNMTYLLQDKAGQITEAHSISAGLDYPGIGPEHSWLHDVGRASYQTATDTESLDAFKLCAELEGILPAIETAHALARIGDIARDVGKGGIVVLNFSGRGDKDVATVAAHLGMSI